MKKGLLLVNLGTPDAPEAGPVRRYLREFLGDPRVLDLPALGRWLLLNLVILPTRPRRSAEAYRKIWTEAGSPLLVHSRALAARVAEALEGEYAVELGMRYGHPSLPDALARLKARGVDHLTVLPLYPQQAASTSGSTLARVYALVQQAWEVLPVRALPAFPLEAGFLDAQVEVARPVLARARPDHVLFSFHGLPERQIKKSDPSPGHCLSSAACCDALTEKNATCYRAQSFATARALAQRLGLGPGQFSVTFQSRLGRDPWIKPYTDVALDALAKQGVKRLAVFCPAFVSDCLETLEEVGLRGRAQFLAAGGEELALVPCVNAHPTFVDAVVRMVRAA